MTHRLKGGHFTSKLTGESFLWTMGLEPITFTGLDLQSNALTNSATFFGDRETWTLTLLLALNFESNMSTNSIISPKKEKKKIFFLVIKKKK